MALLEVSNLGIAFGGLQAVAKLDMTIEKGHLYGLIGPNGAGKTTVFNMLTGVYRPTEGNIVLDGKDITGKSPEAHLQGGHCPYLPEHPSVQRDECAGQCQGWHAQSGAIWACGPAFCACLPTGKKSTR